MAYLDEDKPLYVFILKTPGSDDKQTNYENILQKRILKHYKTDDPIFLSHDVSTLAISGSSLPLGCWNSPKYATCISPGTYAFIKNNYIPEFTSYKWSDTEGSTLPDGSFDHITGRYYEPQSFRNRVLNIREPEPGKEAAIIVERWGDYNSQVSYVNVVYDTFNAKVRSRMKRERVKKSLSFHFPTLPRMHKRVPSAEEENMEDLNETTGSMKHSVSAYVPWDQKAQDDSCINESPEKLNVEEHKKKSRSLPWKTRKPVAEDPEVVEGEDGPPNKKPAKRFKFPHFSKHKKIEEEDKPQPESEQVDGTEKKDDEETTDSPSTSTNKNKRKKKSNSFRFMFPHLSKPHFHSRNKESQEPKAADQEIKEESDEKLKEELKEEPKESSPEAAKETEHEDTNVEKVEDVCQDKDKKPGENLKEDGEVAQEAKEESEPKEESNETDNQTEATPVKESPSKSKRIKMPTFTIPKPIIFRSRKKEYNVENKETVQETVPIETENIQEVNKESEEKPKEETIESPEVNTDNEVKVENTNEEENKEPPVESESKKDDETPESIEKNDDEQVKTKDEPIKKSKSFGIKMPHLHMPKFGKSEKKQTEEKTENPDDIQEKKETDEVDNKPESKVDESKEEGIEIKEDENKESPDATVSEEPKDDSPKKEEPEKKEKSFKFGIQMPHLHLPKFGKGDKKENEVKDVKVQDEKADNVSEENKPCATENEHEASPDESKPEIEANPEVVAVNETKDVNETSTSEDNKVDEPEKKDKSFSFGIKMPHLHMPKFGKGKKEQKVEDEKDIDEKEVTMPEKEAVKEEVPETKTEAAEEQQAETPVESSKEEVKTEPAEEQEETHNKENPLEEDKQTDGKEKTEVAGVEEDKVKDLEVSEEKKVENAEEKKKKRYSFGLKMPHIHLPKFSKGDKKENKDASFQEAKPDEVKDDVNDVEDKTDDVIEPKEEEDKTDDVVEPKSDDVVVDELKQEEKPVEVDSDNIDKTEAQPEAPAEVDTSKTSEKSFSKRFHLPHMSIPKPFSKKKKSTLKKDDSSEKETTEQIKDQENKEVDTVTKTEETVEEESLEKPEENDTTQETLNDEKNDADVKEEDVSKKETEEEPQKEAPSPKSSKFPSIHLPKINWKRKSDSLEREIESKPEGSEQTPEKQEGSSKSKFSFPWHKKEKSEKQNNSEKTEEVQQEQKSPVEHATKEDEVENEIGHDDSSDKLSDFVKDTVDAAFTEAFPEISLDEKDNNDDDAEKCIEDPTAEKCIEDPTKVNGKSLTDSDDDDFPKKDIIDSIENSEVVVDRNDLDKPEVVVDKINGDIIVEENIIETPINTKQTDNNEKTQVPEPEGIKSGKQGKKQHWKKGNKNVDTQQKKSGVKNSLM